MDIISLLFLPVVMIALSYFIIIRPNQKNRNAVQNFQSDLHVGDAVITIGGLYGEIEVLEEQTAILKMIDGHKIKISRQAINRKQIVTNDEKKGVTEDDSERM